VHFTLRHASENKTRGLAGIIDITARKQAFADFAPVGARYSFTLPVALTAL